MAEGFMLQIATPEKMFYDHKVDSLIMTSTDGEIGVLSGHLSMVIALATAPVRIKVEGSEEWIIAAVSGGFAKIEGKKVTVFADTAEWPEEIEHNRAMEAKHRAEERMQEHISEVEYVRSRAALERALMRLAVINGKR